MVSVLEKLRRATLLEFRFLDGDFLPVFSNKPDNWKPSETKVNRGFDPAAKNCLINSDCSDPAKLILEVQSSKVSLLQIKSNHGD